MQLADYFFKPTKQCNLRCLYCSEQENYKNLQVLDLPAMKKIFKKILFFHAQAKIHAKLDATLRFYYTGGEILVLGKKWMRGVLDLQKQLFGKNNIKYTTGIQTNLTLLDQEWVDLFKENQVDIGTSLDLFAEVRPFKGGRNDSTQAVFKKLKLLARNKMGAHAIVVITRKNYDKGGKIFKKMNDIGLCFHVLPLDPDSIKYCPQLEISGEEYARCLIDMAEEYIKPGRRIRVANLEGYVSSLKEGIPSSAGICSNASRNCPKNYRLFFENTGETYFCGCFCKPEVLLGNILKEPLEKLYYRLISKKVFKQLSRRHEKIKKLCEGCEWLPLCNGGCPSFAYQEGDMLLKSEFYCKTNRMLFSYLKEKLSSSGSINKKYASKT